MPGMQPDSTALSWIFPVALLTAAIAYAAAAASVRLRGGWWPTERIAGWIAGLAAAAAALVGPLAESGHHDFTLHMAGHLLLGMTAPLLLVVAAPVTLALRALPTHHARALSHLLRSRPVRLVTHPVTAAVVNGAGVWTLYTTGLYRAMGEHRWVDVVVHVHIIAAGYLFTAAVIGADPAPHRPSRGIRAIALIGFLAAHAILAKDLFGHPPAGVPSADARAGALLMYYGGDLIDLVLIIVFCRQWYHAAAPRRDARSAVPRIPHTRPPRRLWRLPEEFRMAESEHNTGRL
jgi:putative membrane protein